MNITKESNNDHIIRNRPSMRKKCLYSELFWSVFSHMQTEYGEILFNMNAGKYGPE